MAVLPSSRIFAKVFFSLHVCGALTQGTLAPFPTVTAHGFREACVRSFAVELFAYRLQLFELSCNWSSSLRELSCNSSFTVRGVSFNLQNFGRPSNAAGYVIRNSSCSMSHCLSPERPWHRHPPVCCSDHARCRPRVSTASEHLLDTQHEQHGVLLRTSLVSTDIHKYTQRLSMLPQTCTNCHLGNLQFACCRTCDSFFFQSASSCNNLDCCDSTAVLSTKASARFALISPAASRGAALGQHSARRAVVSRNRCAPLVAHCQTSGQVGVG